LAPVKIRAYLPQNFGAPPTMAMIVAGPPAL
jgi:hypothetical protein